MFWPPSTYGLQTKLNLRFKDSRLREDVTHPMERIRNVILIQKDLKESQARALRAGVRGEGKSQQPWVQRAVEKVGDSVRGILKSCIVCVFVCACMHVLLHPCGGHRTTFRTWGSPLTSGSRTKLRSSNLCKQVVFTGVILLGLILFRSNRRLQMQPVRRFSQRARAGEELKWTSGQFNNSSFSKVGTLNLWNICNIRRLHLPLHTYWKNGVSSRVCFVAASEISHTMV